MANNSIKTGSKVRWYDTNRAKLITRNGHQIVVSTGIVVAQSRQSDEVVIVEWDADCFPVSTENVDDLIEV